MMKGNRMLKAAVVVLVAAAMTSTPSWAKGPKAKKGAKNVKCYGVHKCGKGKCGEPGHECVGKNLCKGEGWALLPKESCESIEGASLTPPENAEVKNTEQKKAEKTKPAPMKNFGSQ